MKNCVCDGVPWNSPILAFFLFSSQPLHFLGRRHLVILPFWRTAHAVLVIFLCAPGGKRLFADLFEEVWTLAKCCFGVLAADAELLLTKGIRVPRFLDRPHF